MKQFLISFLIIAYNCFAGQPNENEIKNFIIENQNKICNYKSIIVSEKVVLRDTTEFKIRKKFDLIKYITNTDSMMSGITKFPFIDESAWIFSQQDCNIIRSSITTNNSKIDGHLQRLSLSFDSEISEILELNGRIYTKLTMYEKDCEYYYLKSKYKIVNNIFLPDTTYYYYYSKNDTSLSKPFLVINSNYKLISLKNNSLKKQCWIKKIDCNEYKISSDEILLKFFFTEKEFDEKICFITGEVLSYQKNYDHIGASIGANINVNFRLLQKYENSNIWKTTLVDSSRKGGDYYIQIVKENNNVKISTIRAFVLPGYYLMMADSLLNSEDEKQINFAHDIKLWLSTDDSLMSYFKFHQNSFEKLSSELSNKSNWDRLMKVDVDSCSTEDKHINDLLYRLRLNMIYKEKMYPNIIIYNLGGFLDNEVGYIKCIDESDLPKMFKSRFILIEKISGNWYLYKTT